MFDRLKLLISDDDLETIGTKAILIVGVGGVGGACFEALVRSGFKNITVIDGDCFDKSNLNRQLLSNAKNIGNSKASEATRRALDINQDINVTEYKMFLNNALATRLMLINCEVAEAVEGLRKNDMENFKEEIADIFIRLGDLCGSLNINIEEEIIKKMKKNKERLYKHGKNF